MSIRVIHIPTDVSAGIRLVEFPTGETAEQLHALVEGWYQCVGLNDEIVVWLNEEGKLNGLPWNQRAQALWDQKYGPGTDILVGPAVLTGGADAAGETLGLSDEQLASIERTLGPFSRVRIENAYEDGHTSTAEYWLQPPADVNDSDILESWWDEYVFDHTGDGHGTEHPNLGVYYEATVLSGPAQLIGQTHEWDG